MKHSVRPSFAAHLAAASLALTSVACRTIGPDYTPPVASVPAAFQESNAAFDDASAELADWWRRLDDPLLDSLIERALRQNLDLEEALARVVEARALRGATRADSFPSVEGRAGYQRLAPSENTPLGDFTVDSDQHTVGLDASWELDLWGRVRRAVEAADADVEARIELTRAVLVAVAAEVASNYVQLRALQERLEIAAGNVSLQEQTLALVEARYSTGLVGERDVAQARSNVASTRSRIPTLEVARRVAENRLAVLLGLAPGALAAELAPVAPVPVPLLAVAVGAPADVVRRRPDVRAAERELAAATARIGVAHGDLYPRVALFGSFGFEADEGSQLFEGDSAAVSFGPTVRWNLFDAGRTRRRIAAQDARAEQALARWEQQVLSALEEAENAMTAFVREQSRRAHLAAATDEARRAVVFASTQYTEGLTDFQNVLDSERARAALEDELAQSGAAITAHLIALYKALGGGWESVLPEAGARAEDVNS